MINDSALSWTLLHFLWQGTAIAALLGLALAAFRAPQARCAAGCFALLVMAFAPIVTYLWLRQPGLVQELGPLTLTLGPGNGLSRAVSGPEPLRWMTWLPLLWLTGVAALSARLLLAAFAVHRLTHRDANPLPDRWPHLAERLGLRRTVTFLQSARLTGPLQAGFLKPIILIPASLLTQLPAAQLEAIIAHELAHIARHDYLVNVLQNLVETLLFYHPAVWWTSRVVRTERELCCDQMAADVTGNPRQYAEALITLEEMAMSQMNLTNAATGGDLRRRIARLLGETDRPQKLRLPAVLLALLLGGAMIFPSRESKAQTVQPEPAQQEIVRLRQELAELRAEMAARVQQNSQTAQLSALEAQRLSMTDAQRSLERLSLSEANALRQAEAQFAKTQAQAAAGLQETDAVRQRLAQLADLSDLRHEAAEFAKAQAQLEVSRQEMVALKDRLVQLRRVYQPTHPDYQAALAQLTQLERAQTPPPAKKRTAYEIWLHEDVVYIIWPAEVAQFEALTTDEEREKFIEQFWARRDPNPQTSENEMKEEHYRRIQYANQRFSTATEMGWKTPRGRMYIKKGPPDEIESHPNEKRENWLYRSPREIFEFKLP